MSGKLIYLISKDEYIFITPMILTDDAKNEIQADMTERLGSPVAVIRDCDGFEYIAPREWTKVLKERENNK